ncbi:MAG: glycosyltransferase, partial [Planctomycetota bacterium]|nr:glycosyltransferase [Planctomycetota bacterium]
MKVLMITHGFPPECSGGTESYVLALCQELLERGHEVEVLAGSHEGAGADQWEPRLERSEHEGIPVHRLHRTGLFVDNWEKSLAPEVEPLLRRVLEEQQPDLVHVHHWIRMSRNLVEICHDAGVPAVCTLHDLWTCCPKAFRIRDNTHCTLDVGPVNCLGCAPAGENMSDAEQQQELALFRDDFSNELDLA